MKISSVLLPVVLFATLFSACEKLEDFNLSSTIFIEDPYYPGLPVYSEWGYNTFGAYIDRQPFISTSEDLPAKIIVTGDTLHLILRGRINSYNADLRFSLPGITPSNVFTLTTLDNKVFNLKEGGRRVTLKIGNETTKLNILEGELHVKRVQRLYVDEELTRTIMSGTFSLKTFLNNEPVAISHGRFDLGIGYENFFNY